MCEAPANLSLRHVSDAAAAVNPNWTLFLGAESFVIFVFLVAPPFLVQPTSLLVVSAVSRKHFLHVLVELRNGESFSLRAETQRAGPVLRWPLAARMFCPVDELSDDGDKDRLPSVTSLSDSCSGVAGRKRKKRKRARSVAQPSNLQCDNLRLRALLGKPCKKGQCKGGCMALFSHGSDFAELKAFRNEWAELHKLDQDVVATCLQQGFL